MKIALLFLALAACAAASTVDEWFASPGHDTVEHMSFKQFVDKYEKSYASLAEVDLRFANFKFNAVALLARQADNTAQLGVTKFWDMSEEEFKAYPCGGTLLGRFPKLDLPVSPVPEVGDIPATLDWRTKGAVTAVKDQGQCGSCWAFSTVAATEGRWFTTGHTLTSLSEEEFVDCSTSNLGCNGGWPYMAFADILREKDGFVETEEAYPYASSAGTETFKCTMKSSAAGIHYTNYTSFCKEGTSPCTDLQMQTLLFNQGPLSVCLNAAPLQTYVSGIFHPASCDPAGIDHCVTLVGYGTDTATKKDYWIVKNSWGAAWGEEGFFRLARGVADKPEGICGINRVVTAAVI